MAFPLPKSIVCLRNYSWQAFADDLLAGVTVGLVAMPLAMAFAISSGVPPQAGIYTAIAAGFLISALGGSKTQIGGPTGAFVVIIYDIVTKHGVDGLFVCTLMAGLILLLLGVTGLGTTIKYIPRPVIVGFTNGIAMLIASTQIKDLFGLSIDNVPGDFAGRLSALATHFHTVSWRSTVLGIGSIVLIVLIRKYVRRIPAYIVVMVVAQPVADLGQIRFKSCALTFYGTEFVFRKTCVKNRWIVDQSHALTSFRDFYADRPRRTQHPATATMSITNVVGSGTVAFALAPEPLPDV